VNKIDNMESSERGFDENTPSVLLQSAIDLVPIEEKQEEIIME